LVFVLDLVFRASDFLLILVVVFDLHIIPLIRSSPLVIAFVQRFVSRFFIRDLLERTPFALDVDGVLHAAGTLVERVLFSFVGSEGGAEMVENAHGKDRKDRKDRKDYKDEC